MTDYAMFRHSTPQDICFSFLYVYDTVITGSDPATFTSLKWHLQSEFEMKNLGFLRYFLRICVGYSSRGYLLSQQKYIVDLLDRATLSDPTAFVSSSISTLMELHFKLRRDDGSQLPQPMRYRELVDSLIYLFAIFTDISHAVHFLS